MFEKIFRVGTDLLRPKRLSQLILFITSQCNLHCQHCFYWQQLNKQDDLSLAEFKKISQTTPSFQDLLLSGGEPFLRKDLVEVVGVFWQNNQIQSVNIPSNGYLTEKIIKQTKKMLKINPRLAVNINLSLEGTQAFHDRIRDNKGSYQRLIKSLKGLVKLMPRYPNLGVTINTTVMKENLKDLAGLMKEIERLGLDQVRHYFEIIRGEPKEASFKGRLSQPQFRKIYQKIFAYQKRRLVAYYGPGFGARIRAQIDLASLFLLYRCQYHRYFNQRLWPMACMAGRKIVVIDADGGLRACELRPAIGHLRSWQFRLGQSLVSPAMIEERQTIDRAGCDCTHVCFLYLSMKASPKILFFYLPIIFIRLIFRKELW